MSVSQPGGGGGGGGPGGGEGRRRGFEEVREGKPARREGVLRRSREKQGPRESTTTNEAASLRVTLDFRRCYYQVPDSCKVVHWGATTKDAKAQRCKNANTQSPLVGFPSPFLPLLFPLSIPPFPKIHPLLPSFHFLSPHHVLGSSRDRPAMRHAKLRST